LREQLLEISFRGSFVKKTASKDVSISRGGSVKITVLEKGFPGAVILTEPHPKNLNFQGWFCKDLREPSLEHH
jgi:hypothetical protein